jgi:hypothetical protein
MAIKSKVRIEVEEQGKSVTRAFGRVVGRDNVAITFIKGTSSAER